MDPAFEAAELSTAELEKLIGKKKVDLEEVVKKGLWDGRTHVRRNSALALLLQAKEELGDLKLLPVVAKDGDATVREHCLLAIGEVDLPASLSVPALLRGLNDPIDEVSRAALTSLEKILKAGTKDVDTLTVEALADRRPIVQVNVVELLTRNAKHCVEALINGLLHRSDVVQKNAKEILRMLGSSVAGPLIKALEREELRRQVGYVLEGLSAVEDPEKKKLEAMVTGDDSQLAEIAGKVLVGVAKVQAMAAKGEMSIGIPGFLDHALDADELEKAKEVADTRALLLSVRDGRTVVRRNSAALLALVAGGDDVKGEAIAALAPLSKDPDINVRRTVVATLASLGGADAINVLVHAVADRSRGIAEIAVGGLKTVCATHPTEVLEGLNPNQDPLCHRHAVTALSGTGKKGAKAIGVALRTTNHPFRRRLAAQILGKIGKDASGEVDTLLDGLKDLHEDVRVHSARALGRIGDSSDKVKEALGDAVRDSVLGVRSEASWALDRLNGKPETLHVVEPSKPPVAGFDSEVLGAAALAKVKKLDPFQLRLLLSDGRVTVRTNAATALGTMGKEAHDVLRQLTLALKDSSLEVRHAATQAICELKHDAALCVPALAGALNHATGDLRDALVKAITAFGKDGVEPLLGGLTQRPGKVMATILPVVEAKPKTYVDGVVSRLLTGDPVTVKENAADLLTRLGADASSAEKKLIEALSNDSVLVRVKVIRTLGRVAKPGKAIDDTLRQLAEDDTRISVLDAIDEAKLYLRARARQ